MAISEAQRQCPGPAVDQASLTSSLASSVQSQVVKRRFPHRRVLVDTKRGKYEMPGQGRFDARLVGLAVPDLAYHHHIGVAAQDRTDQPDRGGSSGSPIFP